jgi:ketopantoate reductase
VLQAAGIAIEGPPDMGTVAERIQELRHTTARPSLPEDEESTSRSSLWQDLYRRQGAVEADAFNGEIVELGRRYNLPTPYNRLLLTLSQAMATARELPGKYTIRQLRALLPAFL